MPPLRNLITCCLWQMMVIGMLQANERDHHQSTDTSVAGKQELGGALNEEKYVSSGSIVIGRARLLYQAEAGLQVIYVKDPKEDGPPGDQGKPALIPPQAAMSYVAYFKGDHEDPRRPVTFFFNGGPGSSTVWLHMGAFGPKRVLTEGESHTAAAPYRLVDNEYTLLDASDLVFVDAPGTGFGHIRGVDKERAFYGVDQDARAFANFIVEFLSRHGRWNSPKYLFGESYGTTRAALVSFILQSEHFLDINGLILLSQRLCFDNGILPQFNPSVDQPYVLVLPSYAATAWYYHLLPGQPVTLEALLANVESFALGDYWQALIAGNTLSAERRNSIAIKLHEYTGLPTDYIERANLRITVGEFTKTLLGGDATMSRLDSRFSGPTFDPQSEEAEYDPELAAVSSAYASAFNDYAHTTLNVGTRMHYKVSFEAWKVWDFLHQPPGAPVKLPQWTNVEPDLALAMTRNPKLRVMMNGGYFDLATPFFGALFELQQLPIRPALYKNIETHFYASGHMIYVSEPQLKALHTNVAGFIETTTKLSSH